MDCRKSIVAGDTKTVNLIGEKNQTSSNWINVWLWIEKNWVKLFLIIKNYI